MPVLEIPGIVAKKTPKLQITTKIGLKICSTLAIADRRLPELKYTMPFGKPWLNGRSAPTFLPAGTAFVNLGFSFSERPLSGMDVYGRCNLIKIGRCLFSVQKEFGYARVSTAHQREDRQVQALLEYGIEERNIIVDKQSGKDLDRDGYQLLKRNLLRRDDTIVIKSLDRLSRSKTDIKNELLFFKENGIRLRVIDLPTTMMTLPESQQWVFEMVNSIMIEVLGTIAEQERVNIRQRQAEGIAIAKKKGVVFGRPAIAKPENFEQVMALVDSGQMKAVEAMRELGLKKTSYYKLRQLYWPVADRA